MMTKPLGNKFWIKRYQRGRRSSSRYDTASCFARCRETNRIGFHLLVEKGHTLEVSLYALAGAHFGRAAQRRGPGSRRLSTSRYLLAAPAIRDIQSSDWSRWYPCHERPRRNVFRHDRSRRDDGVVANGHAGKDCRRTTDPDVGAETNWRKPGWTRRLDRMVVRVENGHQVPDQAIVTDDNAVIVHDRGTSVDKDTLAEHKGTILGCTHLDWNRLTAQEQAPARDRSAGDEHRVPPIHAHDGRSRTRPAEYGRGPEAGGHVTNLKH
jgi:hypothetical protein